MTINRLSAAFPRRPVTLCPHCQTAPTPSLVVSGPIRSRVLELVARRPDGISAAEVSDIVYGDHPDGGPTWAANSIKTAVWNANRELKPQGYMIRAKHGPGGRYRLIKIADHREMAGILEGLV